MGNGSSLCSECAEKKREERLKSMKQGRDYKSEYRKRKETEDPRYRRFYRSKEWRMVSARYAHSVGYRCEECGDWGTDVHHVVPIQEPQGWERRFDEGNLKMLCVRCHNEAHGRTFGNGWGDSIGRKAEEAARDPEGAPHEGRDSGAQGGGGRLKVSDFR